MTRAAAAGLGPGARRASSAYPAHRTDSRPEATAMTQLFIDFIALERAMPLDTPALIAAIERLAMPAQR